MTATSSTPRAIGIVRVSQPKGREGESYSTPKDQRERIEQTCAENGWRLIEVHDEQEVSGNALLDKRPGLSQAVTAVMTGSAEVIVGAHTERLWWNHEVRAQVLRLVEAAGGQVWSSDEGRLSNGSAADEFSGTVRTAADRLSRQQNAEKSRTAVQRAINRGVIPYPDVPPPFRLTDDGKLETVPELVPVVLDALRMRADGESIEKVRAFLAEHGIRRSYHGVQSMLSSRLLLGEVHFGSFTPNLDALPAIVDPDVWRRAQRTKAMPGRRAKSERLLARLGVLRCEGCDARMVVGSSNHSTYPTYRCPPNGDCSRHVTVSATLVEGIVVAETRRLLADVQGAASAVEEANHAAVELDRAQHELDGAIRAFSILPGEAAATERLAEFAAARDEAQERADSLAGTRTALSVSVGDWDRLTLDERRGLIRATIAKVTVGRGRGAERVTVQSFGQ